MKLQLTFKWWSNSNPTTNVKHVETDYNGMKQTANTLLAERSDIDHLVIYNGSLQVACWHRN